MDIENILAMTPEEFADAWNNDRDAVIQTSYDALGIIKTPTDPNARPE